MLTSSFTATAAVNIAATNSRTHCASGDAFINEQEGQLLGQGADQKLLGQVETSCMYISRKFATRREAMDAVLDWMAFYNHRQLQSTLGYLSPMQYEQRWYEAQRKKAA